MRRFNLHVNTSFASSIFFFCLGVVNCHFLLIKTDVSVASVLKQQFQLSDTIPAPFHSNNDTQEGVTEQEH